jgi:hypothetical protein
VSTKVAGESAWDEDDWTGTVLLELGEITVGLCFES